MNIKLLLCLCAFIFSSHIVASNKKKSAIALTEQKQPLLPKQTETRHEKPETKEPKKIDLQAEQARLKALNRKTKTAWLMKTYDMDESLAHLLLQSEELRFNAFAQKTDLDDLYSRLSSALTAELSDQALDCIKTDLELLKRKIGA